MHLTLLVAVWGSSVKYCCKSMRPWYILAQGTELTNVFTVVPMADHEFISNIPGATDGECYCTHCRPSLIVYVLYLVNQAPGTTWASLDSHILMQVLFACPKSVVYLSKLVNRHWYNVTMRHLWRVVNAEVFRCLSPMQTIRGDYYTALVSSFYVRVDRMLMGAIEIPSVAYPNSVVQVSAYFLAS